MAKKLKLLVMAIDGATPGFIFNHRNELPHCNRLLNKGVSGIVTGPPFSCDRWFTYYTGLSPEEHGMQAMRLSTTGRATLTACKAKKYFWDYAADCGLRFGMMGGLGCDPPVKVQGFWVTFYYDGFYPPEAQKYCNNLWLPHAPYPVCEEMKSTPWEILPPEAVAKTLEQYDWSILLNWAKQRQHRQLKMLDDLMTSWPVDVLWYYVFEMDWCQHVAAHNPQVLVACYKQLDHVLGFLQAKYQPENILLISDHGITPLGPDIPYDNLKVVPGIGACLPLLDKDTFWTGEHHGHSFYALSGPGIPKGARVDIDFMQVFPLLMDRLRVCGSQDQQGKSPAGPALVRGEPGSDQLWKVRAPLYSKLQWVQREELLKTMVDCCLVTPKDRVLDLGTGTGAVACALAPHAASVLGIDNEPAMLEQAAKKCPNVDFRLMDIQMLDLPDESFDLVTARMVLHHVPDLSRALAEARRVLKKGGRIVICEGVPPSPLVLKQYCKIFALKEPGRNIFTEEKLVELLSQAGFADIRLHSVITPQVSMNNWLAGSGLPAEICSKIAELHRTADADFWRAYNMKEVGDDLLMDWKFVIATGFHQ